MYSDVTVRNCNSQSVYYLQYELVDLSAKKKGKISSSFRSVGSNWLKALWQRYLRHWTPAQQRTPEVVERLILASTMAWGVPNSERRILHYERWGRFRDIRDFLQSSSSSDEELSIEYIDGGFGLRNIGPEYWACAQHWQVVSTVLNVDS